MSLPEIIMQGGTVAAVGVLLWWNNSLLAQVARLEKQVERLTTHLIVENSDNVEN